jgi:hypothetical protein
MNNTTSQQSDYRPTGRSAFFTSLVVLLLLSAYCYFSIHHSQAGSGKTPSDAFTNYRQRPIPVGMAHVLAASYYTLKGGVDAKVMVSNQGPSQMPVSISVFSPAGDRLDVESFTLGGNEGTGNQSA